jgi:hypothetical protein
MFMMLPPRIDSDEEESDSEIADDGCQKDDNESKEDRYFVSFEQGLSLLRFLTMTLSGLARHGGLTCCKFVFYIYCLFMIHFVLKHAIICIVEMLAQSLSV